MLLELGPILAKGSQYHVEVSANNWEPCLSVSECIGIVVDAIRKADWSKQDKVAWQPPPDSGMATII